MNAYKFTFLVHPATGKQRKVKNGYSFTVLFFSFIALLFRRQFKLAGIVVGAIVAIILIDIFILEAIFGIFIPDGLYRALGIGVSSGLALMANELLLKQLLKQGYVVQDPNDDNAASPQLS